MKEQRTWRPAEEVAQMVIHAVRENHPIVVTDRLDRRQFQETYVDPMMAAFDRLEAFEQSLGEAGHALSFTEMKTGAAGRGILSVADNVRWMPKRARAAPANGSPRNRTETVERILAAAEELFLQRGFRAASVHDIAAAAGYTTGAIYSSFAGKDELFLAVYRRKAAQQIELWRASAAMVTSASDVGPALGSGLMAGRLEPAWYAAIFEFLSYAARDERLGREAAEVYRGGQELVAELLRDVAALLAVAPRPAGPGRRRAAARSRAHMVRRSRGGRRQRVRRRGRGAHRGRGAAGAPGLSSLRRPPPPRGR